MKTFMLTIVAGCLLSASNVLAQGGTGVLPENLRTSNGTSKYTVKDTEQPIRLSGSALEPTSEMWFYQQERQDRLNPTLAVQRNAQFDAAQRRNRIAAMKWFGYSNSRPTANPDPIHGYYSPFWAGNNSLAPYMWSGYGQSTVVVRPNGTYR